MSPPLYSASKAPEVVGRSRDVVSATTNGRPSTVFVATFFAALLFASVVLGTIVYFWRKRALAAADLEALHLAQESAAAKKQEESHYKQLDEKFLTPTDPPLKPLILGTNNAGTWSSAYKSLVLPRFVRNKKVRNMTISPDSEMHQRPKWMPRPQWNRRLTSTHKRASTSAITYLSRRWSATAALRLSSSCPAGFQKHQFQAEGNNTSNYESAEISGQSAVIVTRGVTSAGDVSSGPDVCTVTADGKEQRNDDLTAHGNCGVQSVSELSDLISSETGTFSDEASFSSVECVLGSSLIDSLGVSQTERKSALDKIVDDLLFDNGSQDRTAGRQHTHPASELFDKCAGDERLSIWFNDVSRRGAQDQDLINRRQLTHLPALKTISFSAKSVRGFRVSEMPRSLSVRSLPLPKRPSRIMARRKPEYVKNSIVVRRHLAVAITFSGTTARSFWTKGLFKNNGVRRSRNTHLTTLGVMKKVMRSIKLVHTEDSFSSAGSLNALDVAQADDAELFPLPKPKHYNGTSKPRLDLDPPSKSGREPLGTVTNMVGASQFIRPLSSPLLLINGVVADEVSESKQIRGLGDPAPSPPQDSNLLNLTWAPKSSLRPITLIVTVKASKHESCEDLSSHYNLKNTLNNGLRRRSGSFLSRKRCNSSRDEHEYSDACEVLHTLVVKTYAESTFRDFRDGVERALGFCAYFRGRVYVKGKEMYLPLLTEKHFRHWVDDRLAGGVKEAHIDAWRRD